MGPGQSDAGLALLNLSTFGQTDLGGLRMHILRFGRN